MPNINKIKPKEQNHEEATYYSSKDFDKLGDRRTFTKEKSLNEKE